MTADVYLTINNIPGKGAAWTFGVVVQPMVMWLWIGGVLIVVGSILSAVPGRRRRPTDPVSTPVGAAAPPVAPEPDLALEVAGGTAGHPAGDAAVTPGREPVGAGDAP